MKVCLASQLAITMLVMTGCIGLSTVEMSDADRLQVKTIKIRADNRLPDEMAYHGPEHAGGSMIGLVGHLVGYAITTDPREQLLATMKTNNIDLPLILQAEFTQAMQSQGDFRVATDGSSADAEMLLIVNRYGLITPPLGIGVTPILNVSASLRRPDGRVVWQRTDYVTTNSKGNRDRKALDEYLEQPELLREAWARVSGIVSRMLIDHLSPTQ